MIFNGIKIIKLKIIILIFFAGFNFALSASGLLLAGTDEGLFDISDYVSYPLLRNTAVKKICKAEKQWYFLTDKGIMGSKNLKDFYFFNKGLPEKTLKILDDDGTKKFEKKIERLVDLEVDPNNSNIAVTATSSSVFLTQDSGRNWKNLGCNGRFNGITSVAVAVLSDFKGKERVIVFAAHSLYGVAFKYADNPAAWYDISGGLEKGPESIEEIADLSVSFEDGKYSLYAVHSFIPKVFKLDWDKMRFDSVLNFKKTKVKTNSGIEKALHIKSISANTQTIAGVRDGGFFEIPLKISAMEENETPVFPGENKKLKLYLDIHRINCLWASEKLTSSGSPVSLSGLWLLKHGKEELSEYQIKANKKKGIYLPAHHAKNEKTLQKHFKTLKDNKLNAVVIDMKDDYGFVRYNSKLKRVKDSGALKPFINIEEFVSKARKNKIYLIARIVVFKDKRLYKTENGKFAVKNKSGKPWLGYKNTNGKKENLEEFWVDPYNEEVWKYNTEIAAELVEKGFDEIQFDYIRFPTDGLNLHEASYPAREEGMDKESALMSFLNYAREKIKAPISIDIYGANGWYRTGGTTGQEVEMLSSYVDVICPMFYPSHFAQSFLAYAPAKDRPYRIYYHGSLRNKFISENKVIIRPWAQAFYLPVSYDKLHYGTGYVKRQILGIRAAIDEGYVYWNNIGRYKDIKPDS